MPEREIICSHCKCTFFAWHSAKYCSLACAVDSRVLVLGIDQCWPWMGPIFKKDGYGHIKFRDYEADAHNAAYKVHIGEVPSGHVVRHSCDNPICCNYKSHLLLGTPLDNSRDAMERGRVCHGVVHHSARLSPGQVSEIRTLRSKGMSLRQIARQFAVSHRAISKVSSGASWSRIP